MKVSNAVVVGVVCAFASGCAYMPEAVTSRFDQPETKELFVGESAVSVKPAGGLRIRKSNRGNMESYVVRGQRYFTMDSADGYSARGVASWYGPNFHGRTASNGEVYDMYRLTAAHKTLPLPTYARVTHLENGRSVVVKINDRGPFSGDRILDLSFAAALRLGMVKDGTAMVDIQALSPEEMMVMSGPENKLGIDFYYANADGTEAVDPVEAPVAEILATSDPQVPAKVAATNIDDTPILAEPIIEPVAAEPVAAETMIEPSAGASDVLSSDAAESSAGAMTEDDGITDSVLPVVANAAGQNLTTVPAAVQAVKLPSNEDRKGYYIQAGVFADVSLAERVAVDVVLAAPGEEVHVKPLKDSHMYRITVGPIVTADHAGKVSTKLNAAGLENFTVKVN